MNQVVAKLDMLFILKDKVSLQKLVKFFVKAYSKDDLLSNTMKVR